MGLSEDGEEIILQRFEEICQDLNMDSSTKEEAWQNYQKIQMNYTLEGDQMQWLACALYEACRRGSVPTVGQGTIEGNCVSLTRLLRSSKFSLIQFFNKMRKWSDMASLPKAFRDKIDKLERNFAVSTVIFKKFEPIFLDIFINPAHEIPRQQRGRKQRAIYEKRRKWTKKGLQLTEGRLPCTSNEVFKFAWTLFVLVKGNFPAISDDLVNSYHLLLCCIDWIFANAVLGGRKDLLNRDFEGLPEDFQSVNWKPEASTPCIMQILCDKHDGLVVEAKTIKEHWWKPHIRKLFDKKTLVGKPTNLSAILELGNFEENVKIINNLYEEYVLSVGDFDERIFLGEDANEEIGTPGGQNTTELAEQMQVKRSLKQHFDETKSLTPSTPLTGRRYLKEKDLSVTPVSTATQSVSRLQNLLSGSKTSPSDLLLDIFKSCSVNPQDEITQRVKEMGEIFCKHYAKSSESHAGATVDFARKRLQLGESLYYKTLEAIALGERKRLTGGENKGINLLGLLENDFFHRSLFACCLEIVIFSYNSQRTFPWIVDIFELGSYHFYKVIEIIIRAEKGLSRDVVKHLNHIEESILESYAWRSDSPVWDAIKDNTVPNCEDVTPMNLMEGSKQGMATAAVAKHPRLRSLVGDIKSLQKTSEPPQSPGAPLASDRFSSPSPGNAKRRLFGAGPSSVPLSQAISVPPNVSTLNTTTYTRTVTTSGVTIISSPHQLPTVSHSNSASRSILLSQLKGGMSDTLIVSNKIASALAPTSTLPRSDSPPPVITSTILKTQNSGEHTIIAAAAGSGSVLTTPIWKPNCSSTQQAIVAINEDGRQILIPVQIAQPSGSVTSTTTVATTAASGSISSAPSTITISRKPYRPLLVKTDKTEPDHSYTKPKRTGSLALFFRKVYHLASVRLRDLFDKLDIEDDELLKKIWTCFEYAMVNHVHLMCDRHLDQLIMCSMYLIAKVTEKPLTFQNIMKCYRLQPQAHSHVYRSVLLTTRHRHGSGSSDSSKSNEGSGTSSPVNVDKDRDKKHPSVRSSSTLPHSSHPPTPTRFVGGSVDDVEEERGDLIKFYNLVYLKKIRNFALKFAEKNNDASDLPKLSPLPAVRCLTSSPRRVSSSYPLFISPHRGTTGPLPQGMSYSINLSPSKDLQAINRMIKQGVFKSSTKRVLEVDKEDSVCSSAKRLASGHPFIKRLQDIGTMDNPNC
ncbi:retinoblastoma-like protein 2 isoform X2 [Physella acuta]|uniref:retinoblastoma-like protein 2 isoform X2 n=1 Tax=Physella acuta TaxID=109671 RepID=UPI0027DBAC63|nr:retinoblastoma-like protein 2 isoform X2 [Physella acuta]